MNDGNFWMVEPAKSIVPDPMLQKYIVRWDSPRTNVLRFALVVNNFERLPLLNCFGELLECDENVADGVVGAVCIPVDDVDSKLSVVVSAERDVL